MASHTLLHPQSYSENFPLIEAALGYAERGWPVFPCHGITPAGTCDCGAPNCSRPGKHPLVSRWNTTGATCSAEVLKKWWTRWPGANIGIQTGGRSKLLVLDVDCKNGKDGLVTFERLCATYDWQPHTCAISTPNAGAQFWLAMPSGFWIPSDTNVLGVGIDIRADCGMVVAPPSMGANGQRYKVLTSDANLEALPARILDLLHPEPLRRKYSLQGDPVPAGQREPFLFHYACSLRGKGWNDPEAMKMRLREANQRRCLPPIEESRLSRDLDGIVKSVMRYEAGHGTSREHRVDDDIFIALCRSGAMDKAGLGNAVRHVVALLLAWIKQKGGALRSDYDGIRRMAGGHVSDKTIAAAVKFLHSVGLIPFPRTHNAVGNRATNFYRLTPDSRLFRACLADSRARAAPFYEERVYEERVKDSSKTLLLTEKSKTLSPLASERGGARGGAVLSTCPPPRKVRQV